MQTASASSGRVVESRILESAMEEAGGAEEEEEEEEPSGGKRVRSNAGEAVKKPQFASLTAHEASGGKSEFRRIPVPPHRYSPLRKDWMRLYTPKHLPEWCNA